MARLIPARAVLAAIGAAAVVGAAAGLLWKVVTPVVRLQQVNGEVLLDENSGARLFAAEGWFAVIALVGGALLGIAAVAGAAKRGWSVVAVAAVLSLGAGLLAWRLGVAVGGAPAPVRGAPSVAVSLRLSGDAVLALWPLATALPAVLVALLRPRVFDLRREAPSVGAPAGGGDVGRGQ